MSSRFYSKSKLAWLPAEFLVKSLKDRKRRNCSSSWQTKKTFLWIKWSLWVTALMIYRCSILRAWALHSTRNQWSEAAHTMPSLIWVSTAFFI
jgi:hypothetical protein